MPAVRENKCGIHVIREISDLHFGRNELHGRVIGYFVDGHSGIIFYLAPDAVEEAFLQPFPGLWETGMGACAAVAFKGGTVNTGVVRGVIFPDVIRKQAVELREGMYGFYVKRVQPPFLERAEMPLDFPLAGPISYFCMKEYGPYGTADQGKLFIRVAGPIIYTMPITE